MIELLIVIGIVAMLSTLAVGGYGSFRKAALVDLSVDSIISKANEMRDKTLHGEFELRELEKKDKNDEIEFEEINKCFGFQFDWVGGKYEVLEFEEDFMGKKQWEGGEWRYVGCDKKSRVSKPLQVDEMINIVEVEGVNEDFSIRYSPPEGKMEIVTNEPILKPLVFTLVYGETADSQFVHRFELNTKTQKFSKNVQETE